MPAYSAGTLELELRDSEQQEIWEACTGCSKVEKLNSLGEVLPLESSNEVVDPSTMETYLKYTLIWQ